MMNNNNNNLLSSGIQMPFFLTPALRHARKMAKQRAQQEVEMDKKEADYLDEENEKKRQKKKNNNNDEKNQNENQEPFSLFPGVSRRRFFVATIVVAGSEIADARNAAKLIDDMQGEPIVIFLVVLRKSQMKQKQQQQQENSSS